MDFLSDLDQIMSSINYGWVDKNGKKHTDLTDFAQKYVLQSPAELRESKLGVCWDQVEIERDFLLAHNQTPHVFMVIHYPNSVNPKMRTHTFVLFDYGNKTYWYEHAWEKRAGIHEFANQTEALNEVYECFATDELNGHFDPDYVVFYEYSTPPYHIDADSFYGFCETKGHKTTL